MRGRHLPELEDGCIVREEPQKEYSTCSLFLLCICLLFSLFLVDTTRPPDSLKSPRIHLVTLKRAHKLDQMPCSKERIEPSNTTKLRLFADSGGFCQKPDCLAEIFREIEAETIHIAEMAHVIGASACGPRPNPTLTPLERGKYENLLLLCPTCHTIVDKAEEMFPDGLLIEWKRSHKAKIWAQFAFPSFEIREQARRSLSPLLRTNKEIFDKYGPLTDERFNPESSFPRIWERKVRTLIIPTNRRILSLCDTSRHILTELEIGVIEQFRQHADDLEAKHILGIQLNGLQFPVDMNDVFS